MPRNVLWDQLPSDFVERVKRSIDASLLIPSLVDGTEYRFPITPNSPEDAVRQFLTLLYGGEVSDETADLHLPLLLRLFYKNNPDHPGLLLQATFINFGDKTTEGQLIREVGLRWLDILRELKRDPTLLFQFAKYPRKFEEFIAAAYKQAGWPEVVLTPRSNDGGRDVIATKPGFGSIRFLEQCKAYSPGNLVTHDDVSAMLGVLQTDPNASKGIITTTSDFQPGILGSPRFLSFMPHRLELKNGQQLLKWLLEIENSAQQNRS